MKTRKNISLLLRSLTLVLGLITASVSFFEYGIEERIEKEYTARNATNDSGDKNQADSKDPFYLPDYQATISSFQLHLDSLPKLQEQLIFVTVVRKWFRQVYFITEHKYFKTLFQNIISPNAP